MNESTEMSRETATRVTAIGRVLNAVREKMPGHTVTFEVSEKNNGVAKECIAITDESSGTGAMVCIGSCLDEMCRGGEPADEQVSALADNIASVYDSHKMRQDTEELKGIANGITKDFILDHVAYKLVNGENNAKRLKAMPHRAFLDLAVTYVVMLSSDANGYRLVELTNEMTAYAGITEEELEANAMSNSIRAGYEDQSLTEMLGQMGVDTSVADGSSADIRVVRNRELPFGASVMLVGEEMAKMADRLESDLVILPSSINEVLVIPKDSDVNKTAGEYNAIITEVNMEAVSPEDVLSWNAYIYERSTGTVKIAE